MSMTDDYSNHEAYSLSQQSAADEPYFHAGTHRLPQAFDGIPTAQQVEQDIDNGLQLFPTNPSLEFDSSNASSSQILDDGNIDLSGLELSIDFAEIANNTYPPLTTLDTTEDTFVAPPPRRTNSDLRATAPIFIPANSQWPDQQDIVQWTSQSVQQIQGSSPSTLTARQPSIHNLPVQRPRDWMSHMTPLRTNLGTIYQTPPMSAPSRPNIHTSQGLATSPMISVTDEMAITTSVSQYPGQGYQWNLDTPPAENIPTWAEGTHPLIDIARLSPITPVSPSYGGTSLERTASRTSRTSRTTNGPFICQHEGCDKEFRSKTELSHHKRNHGERQHMCDICERKFVFRKDLGRHMRTHTGARQMFGDIVDGCTWCAKGFQRKDHYERHMSTHQKRGDVLTPAGSSAAMSRSQSRQ